MRTRGERGAAARLTRALAKDRYGLGEGQRDGWGKRDLHHDDYRLSSRAKCLRAAAKGREVEREKGERRREREREREREGERVVTTHRRVTGDSRSRENGSLRGRREREG